MRLPLSMGKELASGDTRLPNDTVASVFGTEFTWPFLAETIPKRSSRLDHFQQAAGLGCLSDSHGQLLGIQRPNHNGQPARHFQQMLRNRD